MKRGRILVVDDDQFYQEFCADILGQEGYLVRTTYTGEEALEILKRESFDIMIADLIMPGLGGLELLEKTKQINPRMDVIIMTGYASVETAVQSLKSGAADYMTKPLNPEELKMTIKRIIELRQLFDENAELRSLLTLYESCQRVSLCLETEKLHSLSLDTVLQALPAELGLSFFLQEGSWEFKAARGLEEEEAEAVFKELLETDLKNPPDRALILDQPAPAREGGTAHHHRINSGLVIPVFVNRELSGLITAFRKHPSPPFDRMDLGTARFISEQIHLAFENSIKYSDAQLLVFIDDLTGIFNTRYLDLSLQNELRRAKRFKKHLSLLFMDLDHFKEVNDRFGHIVGSQILIETGKVLKSCVRDIDIVIRYGGDEFIVILIETGAPGARKVAERIRVAIEEHVFHVADGKELHLTCCVGVATFPDDAETKTELINIADMAMYRGKQTTRNVVYSAASPGNNQ